MRVCDLKLKVNHVGFLNAIVIGVRRLLVALHVHMLCLIWAMSITLVVPYQNLWTRTLNTASK